MKFNLILVTFTLLLVPAPHQNLNQLNMMILSEITKLEILAPILALAGLKTPTVGTSGNDIDTKSLTYSFEATPKVSRQIACDLAKARARADIAGEIATEISKQIDQEVSGNPGIDENNPDISSLKEFVDSFYLQEFSDLFMGQKSKTYWEKVSKRSWGKKRFLRHMCSLCFY